MQTEAECVTCCRGAAKCFVTSCLGEQEQLQVLRKEEPLAHIGVHAALTNKKTNKQHPFCRTTWPAYTLCLSS